MSKPSIFDVTDNACTQPEYAVPGTPFTLRRRNIYPVYYDVLRDGKRDGRVSDLVAIRLHGREPDAAFFHEMGCTVAAVADEEARGLRLAGVTKGGIPVWTGSPLEHVAPVDFVFPPDAELERLIEDAAGELMFADALEMRGIPREQWRGKLARFANRCRAIGYAHGRRDAERVTQ